VFQPCFENQSTYGVKVRHGQQSPGIVFIWFSGFVLASGFAVVVLPYFISSLVVYEYDKDLDMYVMQRGHVHRHRDEGWARTQYGLHGLSSFTPHNESRIPTVIIWGDSYIEAHQVNDDEKAACLVRAAFASQGDRELDVVGVGRSYWAVSDYYFNIPKYERLFDVACHIIVLAEHGLLDMCPEERKGFRSSPKYEFVQRNHIDHRVNGLLQNLSRCKLLDTLLPPWKAWRNFIQQARVMRFSLGPHRPGGADKGEGSRSFSLDESNAGSIMASWDFALSMLKSVTEKPIVLVYIPEIPVLQRGRISCANSQEKWSKRLARLCNARQVGYLDMSEALARDYRVTGMLSRGFHNGRPGCGHLNARGHYLLAHEIYRHLTASDI